MTAEPTSIREATSERRRALRNEAMEIMASDYSAPLRLPEVARRIGASNRGLQRAFAENGDGSFSLALRAKRLEVAAQLIAARPLRVGQVAQQVGYRSAEHFTRAFRTHHGLTPRAFRTAGRTVPYPIPRRDSGDPQGQDPRAVEAARRGREGAEGRQRAA